MTPCTKARHATWTLPDAHATRAGTAGGDRATSLARWRRFWAMAASVNSNWAPRGPRNRRRPSRRMRLKCANSISTRFLSRRDCSKASVLGAHEQRRGVLIHIARDLSRRRLGTASGLQRACIAVALESQVAKRVVVADSPGGGQHFPLRAHIDIALLVEREVFPAQRAVLPLGLVDDGNVRRDVLVVDEPVEVRCRPVGCIGRQPFGLQGEAFLSPLDHRLGRAHLRLADGARGFDIHDDAELHVDQIIVGVGEERRPAHRPGRVNWPDWTATRTSG